MNLIGDKIKDALRSFWYLLLWMENFYIVIDDMKAEIVW